MNKNCLIGFKCPKCGADDAFIIECKSLMRVTDDGTDSCDGDTTWDNDAYCKCEACNHEGAVADFQIENQVENVLKDNV